MPWRNPDARMSPAKVQEEAQAMARDLKNENLHAAFLTRKEICRSIEATSRERGSFTIRPRARLHVERIGTCR